jgi:hypothetical protein
VRRAGTRFVARVNQRKVTAEKRLERATRWARAAHCRRV